MRLLLIFLEILPAIVIAAPDGSLQWVNPRVVPVVKDPSHFTLPPAKPPVPPMIDKAVEDCSAATLGFCSQVAWFDLSMALAGLKSAFHLCAKYVPSNSCVSSSLSECGMKMERQSRNLLIAVARVLVTWCYDRGATLAELDKHKECYAASILQAVTMDQCLLQTDPKIGLASGFISSKKSKAGLSLSGTLNGIMGHFGKNTIKCMYESMVKTCGQEQADVALKPAVDEFALKQSGTQAPITGIPENAIPESVDGLGGALNMSREEDDSVSANNLDAAPRFRFPQNTVGPETTKPKFQASSSCHKIFAPSLHSLLFSVLLFVTIFLNVH